MDDFIGCFAAVIKLFQLKFVLYGFSVSVWDVLIWSLVAGIVLSFIWGFFDV